MIYIMIHFDLYFVYMAWLSIVKEPESHGLDTADNAKPAVTGPGPQNL